MVLERGWVQVKKQLLNYWILYSNSYFNTVTIAKKKQNKTL